MRKGTAQPSDNMNHVQPTTLAALADFDEFMFSQCRGDVLL